MKLWTAFLFANIILIFLGGADGYLSCYLCNSYGSLDDCIEHQREMNCQEGVNRCGILSIHSSGMTAFGKGCLTDDMCQEYQTPGYCQDKLGFECELKCCSGNLCN